MPISSHLSPLNHFPSSSVSTRSRIRVAYTDTIWLGCLQRRRGEGNDEGKQARHVVRRSSCLYHRATDRLASSVSPCSRLVENPRILLGLWYPERLKDNVKWRDEGEINDDWYETMAILRKGVGPQSNKWTGRVSIPSEWDSLRSNSRVQVVECW